MRNSRKKISLVFDTALKFKILALGMPVLLVFGSVSVLNALEPDPNSAVSDEIVGKYVQASQQGVQHTSQSTSMEVDINASIPRLKENGRMHALRVISRMGRITYRVLGFQGSNTVKTQVIARYMQAEQQGQGNPHLAVTPANYKFRLKGARRIDSGTDVYVFAVAPRGHEAGLFKGELWLDARTYLPVLEKGRLVKNPSIFFKKVDFERTYQIRNGYSIPQYMNSVITTRVVGKVELDVNYSNYEETADSTDAGRDGGMSMSLSRISSR
jgi:hypothetical protein